MDGNVEAALEAARLAASAKGSGRSDVEGLPAWTPDAGRAPDPGGGGRRPAQVGGQRARGDGLRASSGRASRGRGAALRGQRKGDATLGGARAGHGRTLVSIAQIGLTLSWLQP